MKLDVHGSSMADTIIQLKLLALLSFLTLHPLYPPRALTSVILSPLVKLRAPGNAIHFHAVILWLSSKGSVIPPQ